MVYEGEVFMVVVVAGVDGMTWTRSGLAGLDAIVEMSAAMKKRRASQSSAWWWSRGPRNSLFLAAKVAASSECSRLKVAGGA